MFQATHEITVTNTQTISLGGVIEQTFYHVMLVEEEGGYGPAFTKDEWEAGAAADWELTENGWLFNGRTSPINHSKVTITSFYGPVFDELKNSGSDWYEINDGRFSIRHVEGNEYRLSVNDYQNEGGYAEDAEIIAALLAMGASSVKIGEWSPPAWGEHDSTAPVEITL